MNISYTNDSGNLSIGYASVAPSYSLGPSKISFTSDTHIIDNLMARLKAAEEIKEFLENTLEHKEAQLVALYNAVNAYFKANNAAGKPSTDWLGGTPGTREWVSGLIAAGEQLAKVLEDIENDNRPRTS